MNIHEKLQWYIFWVSKKIYASGVDFHRSVHVNGNTVKQPEQVLFDVTVDTGYNVSDNKLEEFEKIGI